MSLIHNEQAKLFANALDRTSTACVSLGVIAPGAAALYTQTGVATPTLVIGAAVWIGAAVATFGSTASVEKVAIMTGPQVLFFFVLPTVIAVGAWIAVLLYERSDKSHRQHPGE